MKLAALALLAGLSVFSCKKVQQEIEDPQPEVVQNTGNIELKVQNSITFAGNGGSSLVRFTCTENWHAETDAEWLHFKPENGTASGEAVPFKMTVSADANTEKTSRKATFAIVSGESKASFTVTQKAASVTLTDEEIAAKGIDVSRIYTGITGSLSKLKSSDSEFFLGRARTSEHFIVLWDKGYDETGEIDPGDNDTPKEIRVDVDDLLKRPKSTIRLTWKNLA